MSSFLHDLFENLRDQPQRASIIEIDGEKKRPYSGTELSEMVGSARAFIEARGVAPGDRVALLAPNSARWVAADLAILATGAIVVPLYDRQDPDELAVMLRNSEPKLLIAANRELADAIEQAWPEHGRVAVYDEVFADEGRDAPIHQFGPEDTVAIIYTSGTSGEPKGVRLSRANLDFMIPQTIARLQRVVGERQRSDEVFHFLPFCFAAARLMLWTQLSRPNPLMLSTDLSNLVQEMATAQPNYFLTVPAVLERIRTGVGQKIRERGGFAQSLYEAGQEAFVDIMRRQASFFDRVKFGLAERVVLSKVKQTIGAKLEFVISGSAPLSEETQNWFRMLGIPVYQAYGLTETTGIVTLDDPERGVVPGRVGYAIDGVELDVSEAGELLVRGSNVFQGYWHKPEETAKAMDGEWFRTGDRVDLQDGNLKIIGRIKNLIIPESGHNIAPEPLEQQLKEYCPGAEHCVIVGHGKPFLSAIITGHPDTETVEQAIERINGEVPHYRKIRRYWIADQPFSVENGLLTANQKLRRAVIEEHFKQDIDSLYT